MSLQARHGHAALAELAFAFGRVGVVAVQRGQIEGDREAGLAVLQQILEARIGFFGGTEAGEHAHRPQLAAIQRGMHAARERRIARKAEIGVVVEVGDIERRVQAGDRLAGGGDELIGAFGQLADRVVQRRLFPLIARLSDLVQLGWVEHDHFLPETEWM